VPTLGPSAATEMEDEQRAVEADEQVSAPFASAAAPGGAAAAGKAAKDHILNVQSKLFGKPKQYAPEALGLTHLGLEHKYGYESDLWAVGTSRHHVQQRWKERFSDLIRRLYDLVAAALLGVRGKFEERLPQRWKTRFFGEIVSV
jgi:hypothetical protein